MNKNLLLIFASLFISLGLAAQNFTIVTTSTTYTGNPSQAIDALVKVTNISGNTIELIAERRMNNTAPSHESNFCWGPSCYSPFTSISTDTVFLAPGDEDNTFKGTLSPFGATGR